MREEERCKITMKPHDDIGDLFEMEEFIEYCKDGCFIDYDGYGYLATATEQCEWIVRPGKVTSANFKGWHPFWTHVMWYNR